jgi:hypothetical protein
MITYDKRSQLYNICEYSTNVITKVGGEPEHGWGGPNSKDKDTGRPLFNLYGVELEVSTDYKVQDIVDAFPEIFCIGKKDSSVSGMKRHAIEIVTIPATLRKHKDMWQYFFEKLDEDNFDTLDKHTNGMHVHIDRKVFQKDNLHLKKFCHFFTNPANADFLKEISERDLNSFNTYARPQTATHAMRAERALLSGDKHCIVNLVHAATVEVRLFKGIVAQASIIKNLEFCDSIVEYAVKASMLRMDVSSYLTWLKGLPRNRYVTLRHCIGEMNLEAMLLKAKIKTLVSSNTPKMLEQLLKLTENQIAEEYHAFFIQAFVEKNDRAGWTIRNVDGTWVMNKEGTRFAKFNSQTFNMFQRGRARRAA